MNKTIVVAGLILLVLIGSATALAWTQLPLLIQYRINRIDIETQNVVRRYLNATEPFDSAVSELATLYRRKMQLAERLPPKQPPGSSGSLTAITIAIPPEVSPDDPRLKVLDDSAGEEAWAQLKRIEQW